MTAIPVEPSGVVESAGGVVLLPTDEELRVVLVKRHDGTWVLPKGHVMAGEELIDAALREVHEETGIPARDIVVGDYLGAVPFRDFDGDPRPKVNHFFLMLYKGRNDEALSTDGDHVQAAWHELPLRIRLKYPYQKDILSHAAETYAGNCKEAGQKRA